MTTLYFVRKYLQTRQLICKANQLNGFYMIRAFTERFFRTDNSNNWVKHFTLLTLSSRKNVWKTDKNVKLLGNNIQPIRWDSLPYPSPLFFSFTGICTIIHINQSYCRIFHKTIMLTRSEMFKCIYLRMFNPSFSCPVVIVIVVPAITKWIGSRAYLLQTTNFTR